MVHQPDYLEVLKRLRDFVREEKYLNCDLTSELCITDNVSNYNAHSIVWDFLSENPITCLKLLILSIHPILAICDLLTASRIKEDYAKTN